MFRAPTRNAPRPVFNIVPVEDLSSPHPSLQLPGIGAAIRALHKVLGLQWPREYSGPKNDLLDWLGSHFHFQVGNVQNQREHLVLLLANLQMRLTVNHVSDQLDDVVVRKLFKKLLSNYRSYCSFIGEKDRTSTHDREGQRMQLLFIGLNLLIWGEAANLRFMPEALSFIFHNMAEELNGLVTQAAAAIARTPSVPSDSGEYGFLDHVITPLYKLVKKEADKNGGGNLPHRMWSNYDDINEFFWRKRNLREVGWPIRQDAPIFNAGENARGGGKVVGKCGFVEQRTFLNIFRCFDRLWIMHILALQVMAVVAWDAEGRTPWHQLTKSQDTSAKLLTGFITWAALRLAVALLDLSLQWRRMERVWSLQGVRRILKVTAGLAWLATFIFIYMLMWRKRHSEGRWGSGAQNLFRINLIAGGVFCIPEVVNLLAALLPWLSRPLLASDWAQTRFLTWWFQEHLFVGRGLQEGLLASFQYSIFWILLLAGKFAFSYVFQIQPLVDPTEELLALKGVDYKLPLLSKGYIYIAVACLWAPVLLVYFMDMQIWYSVMTALVGSLGGLFQSIGEIQSVEFLVMRFRSIPPAMHLKLLARDVNFNEGRARLFGITAKLRSWWTSFRLQYNRLLPDSQEMDPNGQFADLWNEVINSLREEDLLSDREVELLGIPSYATWKPSVKQWPLAMLANGVLASLALAINHKGSSSMLWKSICREEFWRFAVIESYEILRYVLQKIVTRSSDSRVVNAILEVADTAAREAAEVHKADLPTAFFKVFKKDALVELHKKVVGLVEVLLKQKASPDMPAVVEALQTLYETVMLDVLQAEQKGELTGYSSVIHQQEGGEAPLFYEALELPSKDSEGFDEFYRQVLRLHTMLTWRQPSMGVPANLEAKRRLTFFCNSLYMKLPSPPTVETMVSFSVLTPYYNETVLFSRNELEKPNEDGITILYYLKTIYPDEWKNLLQRHARAGKELLEEEGAAGIRTWASLRGQTLTRTVRGMMFYRRALQLQARLDNQQHLEMAASGSLDPKSAEGQKLQALVDVKFTYVVTCQIYGEQKRKKDPLANLIAELMRTYPALRVAYVDEDKKPGQSQKEFYSVLVKWDVDAGEEREIFRVKLPGPMKLGEGKPENQNHALIFTRGEALQTIDMNQDNYLEEALKMRNLLQEFRRKRSMRKPRILGVREHVFSAAVSSLASFMSAQETAFVTIGQRVLANPLKVRMHYGHPDVFDRLWFLTRGGMSKASRSINISEDIFAGFNCTLRGGMVTHHEYIQVGKGRDVGLKQISGFEAKVAGGNGEQLQSRDIYRLGQQLDIFRHLSFYYSTVGFFISSLITVLTVYAFLWARCYLSLSGIESVLKGRDAIINSKALITALNQQFLVQVGIFAALPMVVELALEKGGAVALWEFVMMQLQLASVFFTFSLGTRAHYFGRTVLHGGAKYRGTGRGFVVKHERFAENFRVFAYSHFVKAVELGVLLIVMAIYTTLSQGLAFFLITLASWFLVITWILAPFIFNPVGLDWLKTVEDLDDWMRWMWSKGGMLAERNQSWEVWWLEEIEHLSKSSGPLGLAVEAFLSLRYFFFQFAVVYQLKISSGSTSFLVYALSWLYLVGTVLTFFVLALGEKRLAVKHQLWYRILQMAAIFVICLLLVLAMTFTEFGLMDLLTSFLAFIPTGWGVLQLLQVASVVFPALRKGLTWVAITELARFYCFLLGFVVWLPVAFLSWLPGIQAMQTRILFNDAFSRGLGFAMLLSGKKLAGGNPEDS